MKSPILVLALLALAGLAPAAQASTQTTTFNKSFSFDNLTVTVSGTITVDTTAQTISGSVTVTVVNDTSGKTIFSQTIPINLSFNTNNGARFVLEVPTFPTSLAISSSVTSGSTTSTNFGVSKTPDINHDGVINIVDLTSIAAHFGTSNSAADLTSDGTVNIQDLTLVAIDFGDPGYSSRPLRKFPSSFFTSPDQILDDFTTRAEIVDRIVGMKTPTLSHPRE